jgi:3,4-dihydroxyphenylacetate 2,3-dioxygenase
LDYGSFVPMQYLDPHGETPVVTMPSVVLSTIEESLRVGEAIDAAAKQLGRRAIVLASSALSHFLVRGRDNWPDAGAHRRR